MAVSITVTSVVLEPNQKRGFVRFSDGDVYEFSSRKELQDLIAGIDPKDLAKHIALALWQARGVVDGSELAGRTVTLDLTVNNFGVVS